MDAAVSRRASDASPDGGSPLVGTWTSDQPDGCVFTLALDASAGWEARRRCEISHATQGVQIRLGSYEVRADELLTALERSSCPGDLPRLVASRFQLSQGGAELSLTDEDGASQTLHRGTAADPDEAAIAEPGCFLDDGKFEAHAITVL